ncbi:MAG: hypothetical protein E7Z90_02515 [Cyanobacteria bacterium SIG29]|nr:hypothetical protein [Cyanobacteria bacterium SIG29]
MSNINWGQFLNNFANNFNRVAPNNVQNNVQNNQQQTQNFKPDTPYIAQPYLPRTTNQLNQTFAELTLLNQQQNVNMLKDLLQFPKNFEQLLTQLQTNPEMVNQKTALILLASTLDLSKVAELLKNNSKDAMSNLYQMLAQYNQIGMSLKEEQLSELTKLISFVTASSTSDVQSLKTTMLMYLPWLPLTDPNAFKLEIANKNSNDEKYSDDYISILIATKNYGNLQADVYKTDADGIKILLVSSETFPQKEFILSMKEESKKYNININLDMATKEAFNKKKNEKIETQISMNTSPGVNPFLLLISNAVIKSVHLIDTKEDLREERKEKLDNGKN